MKSENFTHFRRSGLLKGFVLGISGNNILWGLSDTYLIHTINTRGEESLKFSLLNREKKKISQADKEKMASQMQIRISGGSVPKDLKKRIMAKYSDFSTFFYKMAPGSNGLIYVYASDMIRENGQEIDIFSTAGQYLFHADIQQPDKYKIVANGIVFQGDHLYMAVIDDEGEYKLIKYKIELPLI